MRAAHFLQLENARNNQRIIDSLKIATCLNI